MPTSIHPKKRSAEIWHVYAPCTGAKPFVFYNRVNAFAAFDKLCQIYGADKCRTVLHNSI